MDRYCLVIVSDGDRNSTKEIDKDETRKRSYESLCSCAGVLYQIQSLLQEYREFHNHDPTAAEHNDNWQQNLHDFDPLLTLAEKSSRLFFSIITGQRMSETLQQCTNKKLALLNNTKWNHVAADDVGSHLNELADSFGAIGNGGSLQETESPVDPDSESEVMADSIHDLADELPDAGCAAVDLYWIMSGEVDPDIRSELCLFGALKRLQVFNRASITVFHQSQRDGKNVMGSWRKNLDIHFVNTKKHELDGVVNPDRIWHGSLTLSQSKENSESSYRGFSMSYQKYEKIASQRLELQNLSSNSTGSNIQEEGRLCFGPELHIIKRVDKWTVPLHMFVPVKLKLYLHDKSNDLSRELWEKLIAKRHEDTALLGCFSCKLAISTGGKKRSREDWVNYIEETSGTSTQKHNGLCGTKQSVELEGHSIRMCLLCADGCGTVDVFPLRVHHQFNGRLLEYLAVAMATNGIDKSCQDSSFQLPDLTASFLENEAELQKKQASHFQQCREIYKGLCGDGPIQSESFFKTLVDTEWQNIKDLRSKFLSSSVRFVKLKGEKGDVSGRSELDMDPREWPERMWMYENESNACSDVVRTRRQSSSDLAATLSIKDILKKFLADGRSRKKKLSPLRRKGKENSEDQVKIITTLDSIKQMEYPEALGQQFHGVEYCLDTANSLAKDSVISTVQSSLLVNETLSSYVAPSVPKPLPTHAGRSKAAVNTKQGTKGTKALDCRASNQRAQLQGPKMPPITTRQVPKSTNKSTTRNIADARVLRARETNRPTKRKRESPTGEKKCQKPPKIAKIDEKQKHKESRSQRHKRRLQLVVHLSLEQHGVGKDNHLYQVCSDRLFGLCKSFLKDLHSSHGLKEEMKRIAESNVLQVIQFETERIQHETERIQHEDRQK